MVDRVWFPRMVLRPLGLWRPSRLEESGGGSIAGAGRKGIGLIEGARTTSGLGGRLEGDRGCGVDRGECLVFEAAQDVVGAAAEFARD